MSGTRWKVLERCYDIQKKASGLESKDLSLHLGFAAYGLSDMGQVSETPFPHQ